MKFILSKSEGGSLGPRVKPRTELVKISLRYSSLVIPGAFPVALGYGLSPWRKYETIDGNPRATRPYPPLNWPGEIISSRFPRGLQPTTGVSGHSAKNHLSSGLIGTQEDFTPLK